MKHRWNIAILLFNAAFIVPLFLLIGGVIKQMPEFFFPLFIVYLMIMMGVLVSRADNKRSGHHHHHDNRYDNFSNDRNDYAYNNTPARTVYKPKPRGISPLAVKKKKEKIREKLTENKILQKKYNL